MNRLERHAVILMGHGSRVPGAGDGMEKVAERLHEQGEYGMVETCYMSRLGPHFPETLDRCVKSGATTIVLVPYFLHMGLHTRLDIPSMMKEEAQKYPGVKIIFGHNIGYDDALADIVRKRIGSSLALQDVRDITLDDREKFPLPPGDMEFVPMKPEEAEKFRHGHDCGHKH